MAQPTPHAPSPSTASETRRAITLDDLAAETDGELQARYARGTVPPSLRALDGDLRGRMLAVRHLDRGGFASRLAAFARAPVFPWAGKSFHASDETHGKGINRVRFAGAHRWFPFATRFGASVMDGAPCVILDYDDPANPAPIRAIHDEIREVSPGVFLGPACLKRRNGARVVLWFALASDGRVAS